MGLRSLRGMGRRGRKVPSDGKGKTRKWKASSVQMGSLDTTPTETDAKKPPSPEKTMFLTCMNISDDLLTACGRPFDKRSCLKVRRNPAKVDTCTCCAALMAAYEKAIKEGVEPPVIAKIDGISVYDLFAGEVSQNLRPAISE